MKRLLLVFLLFFMIFLVGCEKEDREVVCTLEKNNKTITVTIKETKGNVTVATGVSEVKCEGDICSTTGETSEKESDEGFDKLVDKYRKDGYSCGK